MLDNIEMLHQVNSLISFSSVRIKCVHRSIHLVSPLQGDMLISGLVCSSGECRNKTPRPHYPHVGGIKAIRG